MKYSIKWENKNVDDMGTLNKNTEFWNIILFRE